MTTLIIILILLGLCGAAALMVIPTGKDFSRFTFAFSWFALCMGISVILMVINK